MLYHCCPGKKRQLKRPLRLRTEEVLIVIYSYRIEFKVWDSLYKFTIFLIDFKIYSIISISYFRNTLAGLSHLMHIRIENQKSHELIFMTLFYERIVSTVNIINGPFHQHKILNFYHFLNFNLLSINHIKSIARKCHFAKKEH